MMLKLIVLFFIIMFLFNCGKNPVDPAELIYKIEPTKVEIRGRELYVNDEKFIIKGVGYAPTPIGYYPWEKDVFSDPDIYSRDLPLLRAMGCNTIRTWVKVTSKDFLDACYNNGQNPIYVIMGFWFDANQVVINSTLRQQTINEFISYVNTFKDHPAVLMWAIGNENNLNYTASPLRDLYEFINEMAKAAHLAEGANFHPTIYPNGGTTTDGGIGTIGESIYKTDDNSMIYLDVWGVNSYKDTYPSFGTLFTEYANKSSKPLVITEFGIDAYDNVHSTTYETTQASWTVQLWDEIEANSDICCGGCIMAYSDEWWKNNDDANDPDFHHTTGAARDDQPDKFSNEEWYGIMAIADNGNAPDILTPRKVYYELQKKWR